MQILLESQASPPTSNRPSTILRRHFFRRFFDNDTLSLEAETETTVVRALCIVATPTLMVPFWLAPHYPGRELFASIADRYFFVIYSFVAMGMIATFEWEMLFPDRSDFLILLPLPLQRRELFFAKAKALLTFLGLFLVAADLLPTLIFSAISTPRFANYFHAFWANFAAVHLAGIFSAFAVLSIEGIAVCLLPPRWFRYLSPVIQALSIALLLLLLFTFPLITTHLQPILESRASFTQFIPPLWFLGLAEHLLLGTQAPAASAALATTALIATAAVIAISVLTYPLAWARQQKRALEGAAAKTQGNQDLVRALLHKTLLRLPQARGIFHFISQTIARNHRYQLYLALYAGTGLALTLGCVFTLNLAPGRILAPALSNPGLHAAMPLLLTWLALGLKLAFAFPVDMRSRWVFPISLPHAGPYAKIARTWLILCSSVLTLVILAILLALRWSYLALLIQCIFGASLSLLLADLFFLGPTQVPFTTPRLPGRTNLPLALLLYVAFFPALVLSVTQLAIATESHPIFLLRIIPSVIAAHLLFRYADHLAQRGIIGNFPDEETDDGPQLLNLSQ